MPIEIEDPKDQGKKKAKAAEERKAEAAEKRRKKIAAAAGAAEDEELVGKKRELWPLIPAIPVVLAVVLSLLPERVDVNEIELERSRCVNQLRTAAAMKAMKAAELKLQEGDALPQNELDKILSEVKCPGGGIIDVRAVGYEPRCSLHGTFSEWVQEQQNIGYWDKALKDNTN